jgi:hypothetical protein
MLLRLALRDGVGPGLDEHLDPGHKILEVNSMRANVLASVVPQGTVMSQAALDGHRVITENSPVGLAMHGPAVYQAGISWIKNHEMTHIGDSEHPF